MIICSNHDFITNIVSNNNCIEIDCSDNWQSKIKRFNTENNECITTDCQRINYKYEYLYKCYDKCPDGTYNNNYKCEKCHPDCKLCDKSPEINNSNCKLCSSSSKFLKFGNCVDNCINGYYIEENDISNKICKCDLEKCFKCTEESLNNNLCVSCNEGYYPKYEEIQNGNSYINCYQSPEGYYLDTTDNEPNYKQCYESCKTCIIGGDQTYHNCIECKSDFNYEFHFSQNKNCFRNCSFYHYFDKNQNIYFCTETFECPEEYNKLIFEKNECINKCDEDDNYKYEFRKKCYKECPEESKNNTSNNNYYCEAVCTEEYPFEYLSTQECLEFCSIYEIQNKLCILNYQDDHGNTESNNKEESNDEFITEKLMIKNLEKDFTSQNYNTSKLENGEDDVIQFEKMTITLATTQNQKNNMNNNLTTIDLGECENLLKKEYKIQDNETLYMKKIDIIQEGMKIPKIDFDVYYKTLNGNLEKLNLTICKNSKISLLVPVSLTEDIDKLNSSSGYYNDICYVASSDNGTDISLKDRKNEFISKNKTVCQDNCIFSGYIYNTNKANCSCNVKEDSSVSDLKIDKKKLYENFINIKNIANINMMVCYKTLFSKEGIRKNIAFFSIMPILIFKIISIILFYKNQKIKINNKIDDITFAINNWELVKLDLTRKKMLEEMDEKKLKINSKKRKKNIKLNKKKYKKTKDDKIFRLPTAFDYNYLNNILNKNHNPPKKHKKKSKKYINNFVNIILKEDNIDSKNKIDEIENNNQEIIKKVNEIMAFNDEEMNDFSYKLAKKYDKRTFWGYYLSLLKTQHIILFTFYNKTDYNLRIIKIDLFLINFIIYFNINALFFNDDTMHKIYEDQGSFNFLYQLPQIIYSSLISTVLNILLTFLALSESNILDFKKVKKKLNLNKRVKELNNKLKYKFIFYFIISFIILFFSWYYLSMFCAIYRKTQIHLIKDTLISFGLEILYPFAIYFLPCIFRIPAL